MLFVATRLQKQGSVSLATTKMTASPVIPESGLVQEGDMMTLTRVETRQSTYEIMETYTSKPWDTFWYTDRAIFKQATFEAMSDVASFQ